MVGDGNIGPLTKQIQTIFFETVRGNHPKYADWCVFIPPFWGEILGEIGNELTGWSACVLGSHGVSEFAFNMMSFALKMMNFVLKMIRLTPVYAGAEVATTAAAELTWSHRQCPGSLISRDGS